MVSSTVSGTREPESAKRRPPEGGFDPVDLGPRAFPARVGMLKWVDIVALCCLGVAAVVLRFWTRSPMWLDEALTVHIASQPLSQISVALHHDGHPPLYYLMLHGWMNLFGTSDNAIRALPGIFGILLLPVTYVAGRRFGGRSVAWCSVVLIAVMPFAIRYSTENRMYSLMMLLALLGWLFADSALRRPRPGTLIALALCTSGLLWSQYWALWLGLAAGAIVIYRIVVDYRSQRRDRLRADLWVLGALAVGAISFIPWVPTMLYQQAHTGTPWASRSMPPTVVMNSVTALGGVSNATDKLGGWYFFAIMLLGLFGVGVASGRIELDLRTRPRARPLAWLAGLTVGLGVAAMVVSNTAFQPRYNAVWLPFAFIIGGLGLALLRGPYLQRGALALVVLASASGCYKNVTTYRTQAPIAAAAIQAYGKPGDVVGVCPDQLGPSLTRVLGKGFRVGSFPTFSDPHTVDWSDYIARTHAATPTQFADQLLRLAGPNHRIFVVWSESYITHKKLCTDVVTALTAHRRDNRQIVDAKHEYYESENVTVFRPSSS